MKLEGELNELTNARVRFISLVDRAATRMPFRILKREGDAMIDLSKMAAKVLKGDRPVAPSVHVAAVTVFAQKTDEKNAKIAEAVKAAGFNVDKAVKNDDSTISFVQGDGNLEGALLVRMSDQMVLAVKGFQPNHPNMDGTDFAGSAAASTFYQGVDSSLDVLFNKICSAVNVAKDEGEAAGAIGKLFDGAKGYVVGLVKSLPTAAFKADIAVREALAAMNTQKDELGNNSTLPNGGVDDLLAKVPAGATISENDWGKMGTYDKLNWYVSSYNKANGQGAQAGGSDGDPKPGITVEQPAAKAEKCPKCSGAMPCKEHVEKSAPQGVQASGDNSSNDFTAKLDEVLKLVTGVATKVDAIEQKQAAQETQLAAAVAKSEEVAKKMTSTVIAPAPAGDNMPGSSTVTTKKSDPRTGCFDTAFLPGRGRR